MLIKGGRNTRGHQVNLEGHEASISIPTVVIPPVLESLVTLASMLLTVAFFGHVETLVLRPLPRSLNRHSGHRRSVPVVLAYRPFSFFSLWPSCRWAPHITSLTSVASPKPLVDNCSSS